MTDKEYLMDVYGYTSDEANYVLQQATTPDDTLAWETCPKCGRGLDCVCR